jgi:hypothetical protein
MNIPAAAQLVNSIAHIQTNITIAEYEKAMAGNSLRSEEYKIMLREIRDNIEEIRIQSWLLHPPSN